MAVLLPSLEREILLPMTTRERLFLITPGVLFLVAFGSFELGRFASRKEAERKVAALREGLAPRAELQDDATLIKTIKAQNLNDRRFSFSSVIEGGGGAVVLPFNPESPACAAILEAIRAAADHARTVHSADTSPLRSLRRINEGSRFFEDTLREQIDSHPELFCTVPLTSEGQAQRTGYPDLRIEHVESGIVAYLDPKLYEHKNRGSTLRSFYYKLGSEASKVSGRAHHLLLGFSHDGQDGAWTFPSWELIDLAHLEVKLKAEFQASNRDLYEGKSPLAESAPLSSE